MKLKTTMVALAAAKSAGADMKQLERDLTSGEIDATLTESFDLGRKLQVNGTPSYVVGNKLIVGAVGEQVLQSAINEQKI